MTVVVAALVEALTQLRIHRVRVLLSLVGVAVAVAALTASVAMGDVVRETSVRSMEQSSGRPATFSFSVFSNTGEQPAPQDIIDAGEAVAERYDIGFMSPVMWLQTELELGGAEMYVDVLGVGADYGAMHRIEVIEGRWLDDMDAERRAPAIVVSRTFLAAMGIGSIASHPTVALPDGRTGVIVGVVQAQQFQSAPQMFALPEPALAIAGEESAQYASPGFELWVPSSDSDAVESMVTRDLSLAFPDAEVSGGRIDYQSQQYEGQDPIGLMQLVLLSVSGLVLLLGALSLVNIAVITVRHRVREFGIRRAFGASQARVFVGVMLESVVGTVVAGIVGIMLVVLLFRMPFMAPIVTFGMGDEAPPFPITAAIVGLAVSTAVGALAGLVPALVAVRSKVIDAIRF